jgi:hypothetical protein
MEPPLGNCHAANVWREARQTAAGGGCAPQKSLRRFALDLVLLSNQ